MGLLVSGHLLIGVGGGYQGDGIEAGGVKGDHGGDQKHQHHGSQGEGIHNGDDGGVQISCTAIDPQNVQLSADLEAQAVISQDQEA